MTEDTRTVAMVTDGGEAHSTLSYMDTYIHGQKYGDYTAVILPIGVDGEELFCKKYWKDNAWHNRIKQPNDWSEWKNYEWVFNSEQFWMSVRLERDYLMSVSDVRVLPDYPQTDSKRAEWLTYRQALRDIPSQHTSVTEWDKIVWPTIPS
jgi:hypothetical protein